MRVTSAKITSWQWPVTVINEWQAVYTKPLLLEKVTKLDQFHAPLVFFSVLYLDSVTYLNATIRIFFFNKNVATPKKSDVVLHPYLPIMTTSLQW